MRGSDLSSQTPWIMCLPNDLLHIIFSKLGFHDKINAGLACKEWEQLLQAGTAAAKHWEVVYDINDVACSTALRTSVGQSPQELSAVIGRWFAKRAPAIKSIRILADFFILMLDKEKATVHEFLEAQLPMLAACLSEHAPTLDFEFTDGFPFQGPVLSSPAFLTLVCPMLKRLRLTQNVALISPAQFATICKLNCLEELDISEGDWGYGGLQALTSDISKLVNLRVLTLDVEDAVGHNPESISGLQKLEHLTLRQRFRAVDPPGLATTTEVARTRMAKHVGLSIAPSLQGLKSLSTAMLKGSCLELVPWELCSLSALTSLEVHCSSYVSQWLPTMLSRLTRLAELTICNCGMGSLPAHIPVLPNLTMLDVSMNLVKTLPDQLSNLQSLTELRMFSNSFHEVPVCSLSRLPALSLIDLSYQDVPKFEILSPLLPILHSGLTELSLQQGKSWDTTSLFHQRQATAEVAGRTPVPFLRFSSVFSCSRDAPISSGLG